MKKIFNLFTVYRSQFTQTAFTLAETLIVIGIIGVVAALTLPNLNHATGDKEKVTRVKKIYSALTDAVDRAQVIYGPCDEWLVGLEDDFAAKNERFAKRITEFMKVSKDCGFDEGCFSSGVRVGYDGDTSRENLLLALQNENAYMVTLSDGTSLAFLGNNTNCIIEVDIDGANKGANRTGNDLFDFVIHTDNNSNANFIKNQLVTNPVKLAYGGGPTNRYNNYAFTTWVVENGNLDYLKADETKDGWVCRETGKILDGVTNTSCQ